MTMLNDVNLQLKLTLIHLDFLEKVLALSPSREFQEARFQAIQNFNILENIKEQLEKESK